MRDWTPALKKQLEKLAIFKVEDLYWHFPIRYENRSKIINIANLEAGAVGLIEGQFIQIMPGISRHEKLRLMIKDSLDSVIYLVFYHLYPGMIKRFQSNMWIQAFGQVRIDRLGNKYLAHPDYELFSTQPKIHNCIPHWTPVYPSTRGLSQKKIRILIKEALDHWEACVLDTIKTTQSEYSIQKALEMIHFPPIGIPIDTLLTKQHPAIQACAIQELGFYHYQLKQMRDNDRRSQSVSITESSCIIKELNKITQLVPTADQKTAIEAILCDLAKTEPMYRLIQGDVGCGKTLVAIHAIAAVLKAGYQVAVLLPTEVLAQQWFEVCEQWLPGTEKGLLTGQVKQRERNKILQDLQSKAPYLIVGTHAIYQERVQYHSLALIVMDEQHRFGVMQRMQLTEKAGIHAAHRLMLTATPIPRTLMMSLYGDIALSSIHHKPEGRLPITTTLLSQDRKEALLNRMIALRNQGRQIYWVCCAIESQEDSVLVSVEETHQLLQNYFPDWRIACLHGKMPPHDKKVAYQAFKQGEVDILVATSVIEVGVDVPNATLIILENAERLGLAQAHQLRGRVGRGPHQSYCILLHASHLSEIAQQRLHILKKSQDGFYLAEQDLALRGAGDLLGTQQSGVTHFKVADIYRDAALLPWVENWLLQSEASLAEHSKLLQQRWRYDAELCYHS